MLTNYSRATKGGKVRNGAQRDQGSIVHAVPGNPQNGFWGTPALCGAVPGKKGYGWANGFDPDVEVQVTCPKCLKKLQQLQEGKTND